MLFVTANFILAVIRVKWSQQPVVGCGEFSMLKLFSIFNVVHVILIARKNMFCQKEECFSIFFVQAWAWPGLYGVSLPKASQKPLSLRQRDRRMFKIGALKEEKNYFSTPRKFGCFTICRGERTSGINEEEGPYPHIDFRKLQQNQLIFWQKGWKRLYLDVSFKFSLLWTSS